VGVTPVRVAVTLGDPRGIGPEVTEAALADPRVAGAASFVRVGPAPLLRSSGDVDVGGWRAEDGAAAAGHVAGLAVRRAVEMAMRGEVDAIVTAPIDKAAFHAGGWHYPGHTEMLQALAGVPRVSMMMARCASFSPPRTSPCATFPPRSRRSCWRSRRRSPATRSAASGRSPHPASPSAR
jgi:4-hydroxythreonine-4-phosphate dehydrogenase